jgi:4-hydroxybenzoate polyprenyltransferase
MHTFTLGDAKPLSLRAVALVYQYAFFKRAEVFVNFAIGFSKGILIH